jgi:hypothetical protein
MPSFEDYKQRAQECRSLARQTTDPIERQELMQMAAQWDNLADYKEKVESRGGS